MRKIAREIKRIERMSPAELLQRARRNKRLMRNAVACKFRSAYAARKALSREYGRMIALRIRKSQ